MKKIVLALIVFSMASMGGSYVVVQQYMNQGQLWQGDNRLLVVEPGATLKFVAAQLQEAGVIKHPLWWVGYARFTKQSQIKTGEYSFASGMTPMQVLKDLNNGKTVGHTVIFIDGKTFADALIALQKAEKLKITLKEKSKSAIAKQLGLDQDNPEGLIYPDTYQYTLGMTDLDVLKQASEKMKIVLAEEWNDRDANLPYKNAYEALVMASIVEKETGAAEERPEIAGVFIRRLQKGMKLQTDPTVIYGLGDTYHGNLTRKHLETDTPYNTYTRSGLPPTPIALPGREAIHAALHPDDGDSLFFVGKGDGTHYFSATLAEHEKAVRQYQLTRKKDYHSAPTTVNHPVQAK